MEFEIMGYKLTGGGYCPEQYDVTLNGETVGYLRLRHGRFTAEYHDVGGSLVYEASPIGDGHFEDDERELYLTKAITELDACHRAALALKGGCGMSEDLKPGAFRVWDTVEKRYLVDGECVPGVDSPSTRRGVQRFLSLGSDGRLSFLMDYSCGNMDDSDAEAMAPGRYLVERWTGRQDQNGQAVYKGHIVKTPNDTGVVDWDDTYLTWVIDYTYGGLADPRWPREVLCDCADVDLLIVGTTHDAKGGEG